MRKFSKESGFTLIELIVVLGMLGILYMLIISFIDPVTQLKKARDGARKSDLRQIQSALEMYRADQGGYVLTASFPTNCVSSLTGGSPPTTYMQKVPCDPLGGIYLYNGTSTNYCLRTCLENKKDSQKDQTSDEAILGCPTSACAPSKWSYTLRNP